MRERVLSTQYSVPGGPGPGYRFDVVHDMHDLSLGKSKTEG